MRVCCIWVYSSEETGAEGMYEYSYSSVVTAIWSLFLLVVGIHNEAWRAWVQKNEAGYT